MKEAEPRDVFGLPPLRGIGDNAPPDPIAALVDGLRDTHGPLLERSEQLAGMAERLPESCDDQDTAQRLMDAVKSCMAFAKNADAARVSAKEPHLAAGRAVDGFFQKMAEPIEALKKRMSAMLTVYQRRVADEERRRREAEAAEQRRLAMEAERAAREAHEAARRAEQADAAGAKAAAEAARDVARAARQDANVARTEAQAKAADLSRARTDLGSVASLRTTYAFEIEDAAAVPREYLAVSEAAIRTAIRANTTKDGKCRLTIPGVRIYERQDTIVR